MKILKNTIRVKMLSGDAKGECKDFPMERVAKWENPAPAGVKRSAEDAKLGEGASDASDGQQNKSALAQSLFGDLTDL